MIASDLEKLILSHIDALINLAGLDTSESATEEFILLLEPAVKRAKLEMARSYHQGLHLDCRWPIVEAIIKRRESKGAIQ